MPIKTTDLTQPACWFAHPDCPDCQGGGALPGQDGPCPTCNGDGGIGMCDDCRAHKDAWIESLIEMEKVATPTQRAEWLMGQVLPRRRN